MAHNAASIPLALRRVLSLRPQPRSARVWAPPGVSSSLPTRTEVRAGLRCDLDGVARRLALGAAVLQLGPVSVRAAARDAVGGLPPADAAALTFSDAPDAPDTICSADPAWLRHVLAHLLLEALAGVRGAERVQLSLALTTPGEAHLVVLAPDHSLLAGATANLGAVKSLLEQMGGDLILDARSGGCSPLRLVLKALPRPVRIEQAA